MATERQAHTDPMAAGTMVRQRREKVGKSQRALADASGVGLSTVQHFELGKPPPVSPRSAAKIMAGVAVLEARAAEPPTPTVNVPAEDLRAVLDEIRSLRRLYESDRDRIEALEARLGSQP